MAPSEGFFSPGKRVSNLAVFSLSRIFKQITRPILLSRARQTFDMLPCPVRPISSKRLLTSMIGSLDFGFLGPKNFENRPTVNSSVGSGQWAMGRKKIRHRSFPLTVHCPLPTAHSSMFAVIDDARDLGSEVFARHDA